MKNAPDRPSWLPPHLPSVALWETQGEFARACRVSPRWLRELEARGLPVDGAKHEPRYPIPHALVWFTVYQQMTRSGGSVRHLPLEQAFAAHRETELRAWAEGLAARPEYEVLFDIEFEAPQHDVDGDLIIAEICAFARAKLSALRAGELTTPAPRGRRKRARTTSTTER